MTFTAGKQHLRGAQSAGVARMTAVCIRQFAASSLEPARPLLCRSRGGTPVGANPSESNLLESGVTPEHPGITNGGVISKLSAVCHGPPRCGSAKNRLIAKRDADVPRHPADKTLLETMILITRSRPDATMKVP